MEYDLSGYTGKGIKVAVVDDGISLSNPDIREITGGVKIGIGDNGDIYYDGDYLNEDPFSHGTMCAAIIKKKAIGVQLYSLKILDEDLQADTRTLIAAVNWSIENGMNIINLSLGTTGVEHIVPLQEVCKAACERGIIIVCATNHQGFLSYPAAFPEVIAVGGNDHYEEYDYTYEPGMRAEFIACSNEYTVLSHDKTETVVGAMSGTSAANARISAIVALVLEKYQTSDFHEVKHVIAMNACRRKPMWMFRSSLLDSKEERQNSSELDENYSWIQKAILYPYDENMHAFVRFADLLNFKIVGVVDPVYSSHHRKDAGQVIGCNPFGVSIACRLEDTEEADTIIIGYLGKLKKSLKKDILRELLFWAVEHGKNVFSFSPIERHLWRNLYQIADEKGIRISYPGVQQIDAESFRYALQTNINAPVVGIFGTSSKQGKFTVQLNLQRELSHEGYKIAQISGKPHCKLFGFDGYVSNEVTAPMFMPIDQQMIYLEMLKLDICARKRPDIFIVGSSGAIMPHSLYELSESESRDLAPAYTLPSIAFAFGTKPDAYILTVTGTDAHEYIRDSISVLQNLGKGQVLAIAFADKLKDGPEVYSLNSKWARRLSQEEIFQLTARLEDKLGIPVACIMTEEGEKKLSESIIDYFAVDNTI